MEPIAEAEVDLDEGELLFHEHASDVDARLAGGGRATAAAAAASDSDEDEEIEDVGKPAAELHDEDADLVLDDGSAKSSTLNVSLEDTVSRRAELPPRPRQHAIAASLPVASNVRMGSSVPIAVPNMSRWRQPAAAAAAAGDSPVGGGAAGQQPVGFVPPHQFGTMVNDYTFSFAGDSSSMTMKRERLKARNAILKSTGFLEPGTGIINIAGLQERRVRAAGGLSQALQQGSAAA